MRQHYNPSYAVTRFTTRIQDQPICMIINHTLSEIDTLFLVVFQKKNREAILLLGRGDYRTWVCINFGKRRGPGTNPWSIPRDDAVFNQARHSQLGTWVSLFSRNEVQLHSLQCNIYGKSPQDQSLCYI